MVLFEQVFYFILVKYGLKFKIWAMLPGFCNFPTDLNDSFKYLAKTLGETLEKCADLRNYILNSLRTLILRNTGK